MAVTEIASKGEFKVNLNGFLEMGLNEAFQRRRELGNS